MKSKSFWSSVVLTVLGLTLALTLAAQAQAAQKVLVLPFKMNAAQDTTYLQQGIMDMLSSRLEWPERVMVLPRADAKNAFDRAKGQIDEAKAAELGRGLGADHVVFGNVTVLGQTVSLDAKMLDLKALKTVVTYSGQSQGLDGVIPKINEFAGQINAKVYGRSGGETMAKAPATGPPQPSNQFPTAEGLGGMQRHPDSLLTGQEGRNLTQSPLNPNFIAAVGQDDRPGSFWRSPAFAAAIIGLDIGDVDGDGKNEIVYATRHTVYVSRVIGGQINRVAMYEGLPNDRFLTLDVIDPNKSGRPKVFISSQRGIEAHSLVLEVRGTQMVPIIQDSPWYFRVIQTPAGARLIGQRGGHGEMFFQGVYNLRFSGGDFVPDGEITLPKGYNIFNFALVASSATGKEHLVGINDGEQLVVMSRGAVSETWKSKDEFAGTMNFYEEPYGNDPTGHARGDENKPKQVFIPTRILVTDLDGDGKREFLVAKNEKGGTSVLPRLRSFNKGAIHSLSLSDMGVRENWRSRELPGFAVDYQVKDYNNTGRPSMVVAVVLEFGTGLLDSRSAIAAYELATPEEMRKAVEKREQQQQW